MSIRHERCSCCCVSVRHLSSDAIGEGAAADDLVGRFYGSDGLREDNKAFIWTKEIVGDRWRSLEEQSVVA